MLYFQYSIKKISLKSGVDLFDKLVLPPTLTTFFKPRMSRQSEHVRPYRTDQFTDQTKFNAD